MKNYKLFNNLKLISRYEFLRLFLKAILFNTLLPAYLRTKSGYYLSRLNKRTSLSYVRLNCVYTQRTRSLLTLFKASRMQFRYLYSYGFLPGLRKASR